MALGRHSQACGHAISTRPEGEPDYFFEAGGQGVWVEGGSPSPGPDLATTLDDLRRNRSRSGRAGPVPNTEMLVRWTEAFKEKAWKCAEYRRKGIVKPTDAFVIAIDGSQLSKFHTHTASHVSLCSSWRPSLRLAPSCDFDRPGNEKAGLGTFQTVEASVENRNKAAVPKERFFRVRVLRRQGAVLGCDARRQDATRPVEMEHCRSRLLTNPLALRPIAPGQFGAGGEEWTADLVRGRRRRNRMGREALPGPLTG